MDSIFSMSFEICDIVHFNKNSTVQNGHIVICHLTHCLSPMSLNYSETQSSVTCYAAQSNVIYLYPTYQMFLKYKSKIYYSFSLDVPPARHVRYTQDQPSGCSCDT